MISQPGTKVNYSWAHMQWLNTIFFFHHHERVEPWCVLKNCDHRWSQLYTNRKYPEQTETINTLVLSIGCSSFCPDDFVGICADLRAKIDYESLGREVSLPCLSRRSKPTVVANGGGSGRL